MKTIYTYFKSSNTGELIMRQRFTETVIQFPDFYYDKNKKPIESPNLTGFVEITEKKFNRESK